MAAVQDVLGEVREVSGRLSHRRTFATVIQTGEVVPMTAPDQLVVEAILENGAPMSVHYRGGRNRGTGFLWEINGSQGDVQVTADAGHAQMFQLTLRGARRGERTMQQIEVPPSRYEGFPAEVVPRNVARLYARIAADLRDGTRTAPNFDDGLALHRLIAAVDAAAQDGRRYSPRDFAKGGIRTNDAVKSIR